MSNVSHKNLCFTSLSLLVSILLILAYTPLGFISIPPVAITTMHIPVIIGSIMLGPVYGGVLGFAFGLISLIKASFGGVSPVDLLFSPFASGAPMASLAMCLIPRTLLGIIPACLNSLLHKFIRKQSLTTAISAGIATLCHTILVLGSLYLFFSAIPLKEVFLTVISLNGLLELVAAVILVPIVALPLRKNFIVSQRKVHVDL